MFKILLMYATERKGRRDRRVTQDLRAHRAIRDLRGPQVRQDLPDHRDLPDQLGQQDLRGRRVIRVWTLS